MIRIKDSEDFPRLKEVITRLLGFDCSQYSNSFIGRRVETRLFANDLDSYAEYAKLLERDVGERERLRKELTIHTTNLYRDPEMWNLFIDEVVPTLVKVKREARDTTLKVWSVGCSTGEEPLTVALCLYEALGPRLGGFSIQILATDIDEETLRKAREALYEELQFRELPEAYKERYFSQVRPGLFRPSEDLLRLITYQTHDIHCAVWPKRMDIILCRNTVIYFGQESKRRVYERAFDSLNPGGFFIMGKTETLLGPASDRFQIFNVRERVFFRE